MNRQRLASIRGSWLSNNWIYECSYFKDFDFTILNEIMYIKRRGRGHNDSANDCIIMFDTETSKKRKNPFAYNKDGTEKYVSVPNHICAWTISIRAFRQNICTLYGSRPSEFIECVKKIMNAMEGDTTIMYAHNLAYDYVFLRKFLFQAFGEPIKQLNTKPHYPILIGFNNGLLLKDSLIVAQRSLDKWAKDMAVEHQKASGKWDYDLIRNQQDGKPTFSEDELEYIEHDTLAGVECLDALIHSLNKDVWSAPYTATSIPREEIRKRAEDHNYHEVFLRLAMDLKQYIQSTKAYHGGFTHANRHLIEVLINWIEVWCFDFASSYPYVLLSEKYPCESFHRYDDMSIERMLELSVDYGAMFKLIMINPRIKNDDIVMPALQFSKCVKSVNVVLDNGRIITSDYIECYMTSIDLRIIAEQYDYDCAICTEVEIARMDYLPRWMTDYVYKLFEDKTMLKGSGDAVSYALAKSKLNSVYGMFVQHSIREDIMEDFQTGEYVITMPDPEEAYNKYLSKHNSVLNYQVGVFCTAYAQANLFTLGKCVGTWVYSDTDSIYGYDWNIEAVNDYNNLCKYKLMQNGYGPVKHNGREYWLGIAEHSEDDEYTEFKVMGAKRYAGRCKTDGELHITVAGVPKKKGAMCLKDNLDNFTAGCVFDSKTTGKMMHTYIYADDIYTDQYGNETGDSIDLTYCDYLLDSIDVVKWHDLETREIQIQLYEEDTGDGVPM